MSKSGKGFDSVFKLLVAVYLFCLIKTHHIRCRFFVLKYSIAMYLFSFSGIPKENEIHSSNQQVLAAWQPEETSLWSSLCENCNGCFKPSFQVGNWMDTNYLNALLCLMWKGNCHLYLKNYVTALWKWL